ncbi:AAA family ATPase [Acetobacteraceae bacterium ESL0709]|nr:AAA family ATPase [Acetobacteraceae bacterium ESL0697]MDF7678224.1 AAA family ATPase [Acetobacteraceae bacterium ESL0709]
MTASNKAHFSRLTIAGFKSFADEVTVEILPGLTGIIGPNGCGKSNIVDALRWVMGESSAKALRGGDSDDLIFAGTSARPARNLAQVTVQLDDAQGLAQPPFQDSAELVIARQAERGSNSTYRLNNTVVRAKDIQMLFADMDSGARSSAIISQNRVSQIIEVKPEERRVLLEEAAGIKGLYVRRKDAETKLKQAQTNLDQAQTHLENLQKRISTLSDQSEQAQTYRTLSESIRRSELQLLLFKHNQANAKVETSRKELSQARDALTQTETLLKDKKAAFEALQQEQTRRKNDLEQMRPHMEEQKLQLQIAQNNLSHIQKAWDERTQNFNELVKTLDDKTAQLTALNAQEADYQKDIAALQEGYDPTIDLPVLKQKIDTQEKALDDCKSACDKAKEDYHQATLRYETVKGQCDNLRQQLKQNQNSLDRLQTDLQKVEQACSDSSILKEAEHQAELARETATKAEQDKAAYSDLCQEQKIDVANAKSALEDTLRRQKHLISQGTLLAERLKLLDIRRRQGTAEKKSLESSLISPEQLASRKQELEEARALLAKADAEEKSARDQKEKQEEIWLKVRAACKEKSQKKNLVTLEITRLTRVQQTTAQHLAQAQKALTQAQNEKASYDQVEALRDALADKEKLSGEATQDLKSWQEELKSSFGKLTDTRRQLNEQELQLIRVKGEADGIQHSLQLSPSDDSPSLLQTLEVEPDYANALAVALAEGLDATLVSDDSMSKRQPYKRAWRTLSHGDPLPSPLDGLQTLADFVKAPPALSRALNAVYILEDTSQGPTLQAHLSPGVSLIARDGSFWRWDGFIQSAEIQSPETRKLQNLQKLRELRIQEEALEQTTKKMRALADDEQNHNKTLQANIEKRRNEATTLEKDLAHLRFQVREQEHGLELTDKRIQYAQEQIDKDLAATGEIRDNIAALQKTLAELDEDQGNDKTEEQKAAEARDAVSQAHKKRAELYQSFSKTERDCTQLQLRSDNMLARLKDLVNSLKHVESDFETLSQQKQDFEEQLSQLDLAGVQKTLSEKQAGLNEKLATLAQMETRSQALKADAERTRSKVNTLTQEQSASLGRRDTLRQQVKTQHDICLSLEKNLKESLATMEALPPLAEQAQIFAELQSKFEKDRLTFQNDKASYEALDQKTRSTTEQLKTLTLKLQSTGNDTARLSQEVHDLRQKKQAFELSRQSYEDPAQLAQQVKDLHTGYESLTSQYNECDQKLASLTEEAENSQAEVTSLQEQYTTMREKLSGLTERLTQAQNQLEQLQAHDPLSTQSGDDLTLQNDLPGKSETVLRKDITKFQQDRDNLGTVNLKAEEEHDQASKEADALQKELSDLSAAIDKQQKVIATINREGRTRLNAVFSDVDQHFQSLFARIFGGGKAHLALVGSDDPLEAGLEIYAQPPGKKLSTLSLLSGGEQALTALSLIFAAFFCNPAPICVLDEIDAPLDETNVEQFCRLIIDINKQTGTRFLVVTHHQVTMAHMNQLYGVTMQERGVSRVLSVNLNDSSQFIGS